MNRTIRPMAAVLDVSVLERFVVRAKAETYAAGANRIEPSRLGSHDLGYVEDGWRYRDSYFGGTDFVGQEVVWFSDRPVWAMNYYGRILADEKITAERAGQVIMRALSALYAEARFLGGWEHTCGPDHYVDTNRGNCASFDGLEWIEQPGPVRVYELRYHGGLVRP